MRPLGVIVVAAAAAAATTETTAVGGEVDDRWPSPHCTTIVGDPDRCFAEPGCTVGIDTDSCRPKECGDLPSPLECEATGPARAGCQWLSELAYCSKTGVPPPCYLYYQPGSCPPNRCVEDGASCIDRVDDHNSEHPSPSTGADSEGDEDRGCADVEHTGVKLQDGSIATCYQLAVLCDHAKHSEAVQHLCPASCGLCGDQPAQSTSKSKSGSSSQDGAPMPTPISESPSDNLHHCNGVADLDACMNHPECAIDITSSKCRARVCSDRIEPSECSIDPSCEWIVSLAYCNRRGHHPPCHLYYEEGSCPQGRCKTTADGYGCEEDDTNKAYASSPSSVKEPFDNDVPATKEDEAQKGEPATIVGCVDSEATGFDLRGGPASCTSLRAAGLCDHPDHGEEIKSLCPQSCGLCADNGHGGSFTSDAATSAAAHASAAAATAREASVHHNQVHMDTKQIPSSIRTTPQGELEPVAWSGPLPNSCSEISGFDLCLVTPDISGQSCYWDWAADECRKRRCSDIADAEDCNVTAGCEYVAEYYLCKTVGDELPCFAFWSTDLCPEPRCTFANGYSCVESESGHEEL